jgi:hypothetical protein
MLAHSIFQKPTVIAVRTRDENPSRASNQTRWELEVISKTRGLDVATDIIEQSFQKYQTEVPRDSRSVARGKHKTPEEMQEASLTQ